MSGLKIVQIVAIVSCIVYCSCAAGLARLSYIYTGSCVISDTGNSLYLWGSLAAVVYAFVGLISFIGTGYVERKYSSLHRFVYLTTFKVACATVWNMACAIVYFNASYNCSRTDELLQFGFEVFVIALVLTGIDMVLAVGVCWILKTDVEKKFELYRQSHPDVTPVRPQELPSFAPEPINAIPMISYAEACAPYVTYGSK